MQELGALLISYLLGSVPVGYLAGRWIKGIDIRQHGSGNIGATNAFRIMGRGVGLAVLAGDVMKGALAVWLGRAWGGDWLAVACGLAAVSGHNWSVFLGGRGGRGVATAAGMLLALMPQVLAVVLLVWGLVVLVSGYISLASIVAALSAPVLVLLLRQPTAYFLVSLVAALLIAFRHQPNIQRLRQGKEPKVKWKG